MLDNAEATHCGLRRSTEAGRRAAALADGYAGLPDGVTRWRLAAALRAAARPLGLTGPMLRLLEHYIDLTYDQDWAPHSEPIVTRPLVEIAEHLDRTERQIRNIERSLVEAGLLAWRDSGNHHRKGRRDHKTGRLIYAYGPSLAPLGARADEIIAAAAASRAHVATARRLRIAISALRRRIRVDLAAARGVGIAIDDLSTAFASTPARHPAGLPPSALAARRDTLVAIADALTLRLAPTTNAAQGSGKPEIIAPTYPDTITRYAMNSRIAAKGVSKTTDRQGDHGVQHVPLALAIEAAGPLLTAAISARMDRTASWLAVIDAAADVAPLMGIDKTLWSEACGALGRHGAALAILIIERGSELRDVAGRSPPIQRPPAYLRGMLARGRTGALRLDRSVRGWALRKT